jgi:hypothetical protein
VKEGRRMDKGIEVITKIFKKCSIQKK